jgi:hypothetical protein
MRVDGGDAELRRYLLGQLTDEECAALEQDYFTREDALERMSAAESDLIDEYVSNALAAQERTRFESHYLIPPAHRARVDMARQLRAAAGSRHPAAGIVPAGPSWRRARESMTVLPIMWKVAAAASVLLVAAAAVWIAISRLQPQRSVTSGGQTERRGPDRTQERERDAPANSPGVVAISLSPATVRGASESLPLTIPPGAERIRIVLEGADAGGTVTSALIRKVAGDQVWRVAATAGEAPGELARLEVPASVLPPDDYVIELFGRDPMGRESERSRYVLRVRAP